MILLTNNQILISEIEEVAADIGEPDCKLVEPFLYNQDKTLSPWLVEITNKNVFMIQSDKIVTIVDPKPTILEKYLELLK